MAAQLRRVGKLKVGLAARGTDVTESYRAVRRKARMLALATVAVVLALLFLALFTVIAARRSDSGNAPAKSTAPATAAPMPTVAMF